MTSIRQFGIRSMLVAGTVVLSAALATAQDSAELFLGRAEQGVREYIEAFRDLTAEETGMFERFDVKGLRTAQRTVTSTLIIYRSQTNPAAFTEYRLVQAVNGREVKDRDKRMLKLWEELANSRSLKDELHDIRTEGNRYNLGINAQGFTLFQGLPLMPQCRPAFQFHERPEEAVAGRLTRVFSYTQLGECEFFTYKFGLPAAVEQGRRVHRGRIWLDAVTARLLREERNVYVVPSQYPDAMVLLLRVTFEYAPGRFGVFAPTLIVMEDYYYGGQVTPGVRPTLRARSTQRYGPFSRFEVNTEQKIVPPTTPK